MALIFTKGLCCLSGFEVLVFGQAWSLGARADYKEASDPSRELSTEGCRGKLLGIVVFEGEPSLAISLSCSIFSVPGIRVA